VFHCFAGLCLSAACSEYNLSSTDKGGYADSGEPSDSGGGSGTPECEELTCVEPTAVYPDEGFCRYWLDAGDFNNAIHIDHIFIFGEDGGDGSSRPADGQLWFTRESGSSSDLLTSEPLSPADLTDAMKPYLNADWYAAIYGPDLGTLNDGYDDPTSFSGGLDVLRIGVPVEEPDQATCDAFLRLEVCIDCDVGEWWFVSGAHDDDTDWVGAEKWTEGEGECGDEKSAAAARNEEAADTGGSDGGEHRAEARKQGWGGAPVNERVPWWTSERARSGGDACRPGSGVFHTAPMRVVENRQSGLSAIGLVPLQTDGTGNLTATARVTSWRQLSGPTVATAPRELFDAAFGAKAARAFLGLQPAPRAMAGDLWFGMQGVSRAEPLDASLEISWDCPGTPIVSVQPSVPSYGFSLAELGCAVEWPQRFALSRRGTAGRGRLRVQLDGRSASLDIGDADVARLPNEIKFQRGELVISGVVVGEDETAATVRLEEATWRGWPICQTGVYRLPAVGW
jgi:hypothetical protein